MLKEDTMDYEIDHYYVDNNPNFKFYTIESAKEFATELAKELHYYPSIHFVARVIEYDE